MIFALKIHEKFSYKKFMKKPLTPKNSFSTANFHKLTKIHF